LVSERRSVGPPIPNWYLPEILAFLRFVPTGDAVSEQVWWYATRAAGLMTWTTATASVIIGLLLSTRAVKARTGPWFLDLHRFLGGISVVFLIAHVGTLWADSFVDFGAKELFVPGASVWKPEAIAWGIIAAYLLVAIEVSSLLRRRINKHLWRVLHFSSFAAMIGGSYHAYLAGSDVDNPITWVIAGIGSLLVLGLISMRLQRQDPEDPNTAQLPDNLAILEEMRRRLEELPIPESTPQPQISLTPNASLPRRAPISDSSSTAEPDPIATPSSAQPVGFGDGAFVDDPFAAVPLNGDEPELGDWAKPPAADPFGATDVDPFRNNSLAATDAAPEAAPADTVGRYRARPFTDRETWADDGADLFDGLPGDPFEALGVAPMESSVGFPELSPLKEKHDLFAVALPGEPDVDFLEDPFALPIPTGQAIQEPAPNPHFEPPPLPEAGDSDSGEPDEAAYTQWLKEWLVYAEKYGEEAPEDPSRAL
jgi:DMSO/TMAO reductase YedYZ heme-binding membrane subunit